jgi:hypothetical protein
MILDGSGEAMQMKFAAQVSGMTAAAAKSHIMVPAMPAAFS